jgi:hypothetical protein
MPDDDAHRYIIMHGRPINAVVSLRDLLWVRAVGHMVLSPVTGLGAESLRSECGSAFGELAPRCRELLSMLMAEPPRSYAEISTILQIPVGSIAPSAGAVPGTAAPLKVPVRVHGRGGLSLHPLGLRR